MQTHLADRLICLWSFFGESGMAIVPEKAEDTQNFFLHKLHWLRYTDTFEVSTMTVHAVINFASGQAIITTYFAFHLGSFHFASFIYLCIWPALCGFDNNVKNTTTTVKTTTETSCNNIVFVWNEKKTKNTRQLGLFTWNFACRWILRKKTCCPSCCFVYDFHSALVNFLVFF